MAAGILALMYRWLTIRIDVCCSEAGVSNPALKHYVRALYVYMYIHMYADTIGPTML